MNILIWAMLGGIIGWLASFFAQRHQKLVMCLDLELMTIGTALGVLSALANSAAEDGAEAVQSSPLILFLSALE